MASVFYEGEHSLNFIPDGESGDWKNTWEEWGLAPTSRPVISLPEPVSNYVEIPGTSGSHDLTDQFGYPAYGMRQGSIEFMMVPEFSSVASKNSKWNYRYANLANYFHGRKLLMYLDDDTNYYYSGRWSVSWSSPSGKGELSRVMLNYTLDPWKYVKEGWRGLYIPSSNISSGIGDYYKYTRGSNGEFIRGDRISTNKTLKEAMADSVTYMTQSPYFRTTNITGGDVSVFYTNSDFTGELNIVNSISTNTTTRFPSVIIREANDGWDMDFTGTANLEIIFRLGRL